MTTRAALSILDFCTIYEGETPSQSMARSVELAQQAEALGFERMWYTEHHNMPSISSSAPAVLIAHIGAKTERIRLGSGGIMLRTTRLMLSPNNSAPSPSSTPAAST